MIDTLKQFFENKENLRLVIIIASGLLIFLVLVFTLLLFNAKKKKYRRSLELLRERIQSLKQHEVINNYTSYDNLKNDQKLGMLVLRWKKAIENLVKEIDAQYSMLDVLEDAIDQNNYQYYVSMLDSCNGDIDELDKIAEKLNDEITEYVDKASDNRKYINKYYEMFTEIYDKFKNNESDYQEAKEKVKVYLDNIKKKFDLCHTYITNSQFEDADNYASIIFKEIKFIDYYLDTTPKIINNLTHNILPGLSRLETISKNFSETEIEVLYTDFSHQLVKYNKQVSSFYHRIFSLDVENIENDIKEIDVFIKTLIKKFEGDYEIKNTIIESMSYQKEYLNKIENTAKNFISIFKVVLGSYNITDKEIKAIEELIIDVEEIKSRLLALEMVFNENKLPYNEIKSTLELLNIELNKLSKFLDSHLKIIDEIYSDEKNAREKIALMTEKINGTKKYIKYANLDGQGKYLQIIKNLNLELSSLYLLLSAFPIDIVRLNNSLETLTSKIEKTTQEINGVIYKTLLAEYVLLYANRYFNDKMIQKELLIAENLFYTNQPAKAYDRVISILDSIDPSHKKIVLEKYQENFSEIFK